MACGFDVSPYWPNCVSGKEKIMTLFALKVRCSAAHLHAQVVATPAALTRKIAEIGREIGDSLLTKVSAEPQLPPACLKDGMLGGIETIQALFFDDACCLPPTQRVSVTNF
ncbi:hypothetical protein AVEN_267330-1 [Araneus ventricosus]|uniref:Uncharacterized protein n=1 Tax=Araneus ventricosus TaxID=182803 RepID=A0A4Y2DJG0_ARAVE|nr:hypothetical protein AVEN_267330-1 [Araneus ventricosus]